VATGALTALLEVLEMRPLYAHVARQNVASARVLEKCGFRVLGEEDDGFALILDDAAIR
jgi:RimJ/RimL family protein N-acetyltransferase